MSVLTVCGLMDDYKLHRAKEVGEELAEKTNCTLDFQPMLEPEWEEYRAQKALALGGKMHGHTKSPLILLDGENYVGGLEELEKFAGEELSDFVSSTPEALEGFKTVAQHAYIDKLRESGSIYCFQDIKMGDSKPRRMVYELYAKICPKTCENFRALCTGEKNVPGEGTTLDYKNSPIHRIVRDGWAQGGDIVGGKGNEGESIYGETFPDESFAMKFDSAGVLAMANDGAHSNGSQFFVTLAPLPWLNTKAVAFGKVIKGTAVLRALNRVETYNERPVDTCAIAAAGEVDLTAGYGL